MPFSSLFGHRYKYEPIGPEGRRIRLLTISKSADGILRGDLREHDLDNIPAYNALSYTWQGKNIREIEFSGRRLKISQSLHDFLEIYQSRSNATPIWIDQICINQKKTKEKNQQVQMMEEIYRRALGVIIWIPGWPEAPEMIRKMVWDFQLKVPPEQEKIFKEMLSYRYWSRLWIMQEVLLANRLQVFCGSSVLEWTVMPKFCQMLAKNDILPPRVRFLVANSMRREEQQMDFELLFANSATSNCVDPRDKVYGLQSLLPTSLRLKVDYNKDASVVFYEEASRLVYFFGGDEVKTSKSICNLGLGMGVINPTQFEFFNDYITDAIKKNRYAYGYRGPNYDAMSRAIMEFLKQTFERAEAERRRQLAAAARAAQQAQMANQQALNANMQASQQATQQASIFVVNQMMMAPPPPPPPMPMGMGFG